MKKYYINLDRSKNRKKFMETLYKDIIRIEAYDGKKLNEYNDIILPEKYEESPNALACSLSHIKAIITAYKNGDKEALILEDDISNIYKNRWKKSIQQIINEAPNDTECIKFHCNNLIKLREMIENKVLYKKWHVREWGTQCYYVNKKAMTKIYNLFYKNNKINLNIKLKNYLADYGTIFQNLITYSYCRPLFINEIFNTTIHKINDRDIIREKKVRYTIIKYFRNLK